MSDVRQRPGLTDIEPASAEMLPRPGLSGLAYVVAARFGDLMHGVALVLLTLALGLGLGLGVLAWRLSKGPLDVTGLEQWAASYWSGPAMTVGAAALTWTGFDNGAGRALHIDLSDVRLAMSPGQQVTVQHAIADLSVAGLLRREAVPRTLTLHGVRAAIPLGGLDNGTGTAEGGWQHVLDALTQPARTDRTEAGPALLRQLRTVVIDGADITLTNADGTEGGRIRGGARFVRQPAGGVTGSAQMHLNVGAAQSDATLTAGLAPDGTQVDLTLTPVDLAALGSAVPALADLAAIQAAVSAHVVVQLTPALGPRALDFQLATGHGRVVAQSVALPFDAVSVAGSAAWDLDSGLPARAALRRVQVVLASPSGGPATTAVLTGDAVRAGGALRARGAVTLDRLAVADLGGLWPERWGGHARPWIVQNLTAGIMRNGHAAFTIDAGENGAHPKLSALTAALTGDDVTIHWLRPVPPVEHMQASLVIATPDVIEITASSGRQGTAQLQNALLRITGMSVKDQDLSITLGLNGTVPELITVLKHPRLHLLSDHPIPVQRPAGTMVGTLQVTLPLEGDLQFEQVGIHAAGKLSGLRLGSLVAGRDLDRGEIAVDVTQDGLHASGPAAVAGFMSDVDVVMDFKPGPPEQVTQRATLNGRGTPKQMAATGLDPGSFMPSGVAAVAAVYTEQRGGRAEVTLHADLREAALAVAGWTKPPGSSAEMDGRLSLLHGHLVGLDGLRAAGPGLRIEGRAELIGDQPSRLVLDPIEVGPTRARGSIVLPRPGAAIRLDLSGSVLDLSSLFGTNGRAAGGGTLPAFVADLRFDRVLLARNNAFGMVRAHAEHDETRLTALKLLTGGMERIQAEIVPEPGGRRLSVHAEDAGTLLRALDVTDSVVGGALGIQARFDDRAPGSPLAGTADLTDFHVQNAPAVGKLLQAISVFGLPEALSGPGLKLNRMTAPFVWGGDSVYLGESQASSASLGLTAKGRVDMTRHTLDVTGTVVPLYAVNAALGRIPLVGRLFSPERGGGLISLSYGLHGPLADPSVAVNPLSILTPGLARRLFRLFD